MSTCICGCYVPNSAPESSRGKCHVYVIEGVGTGKFKVGSSNSIDKRLRDMRNGSPVPLKLLWSKEYPSKNAAMMAEHSIHEALAPIHSHGEWFTAR